MLESSSMSAELLKARVENGRYVVDATTDLPDGHVVSIQIVSHDPSPEESARFNAAINESLDELDDEERVRLHASLESALDDEDASRVVDVDEFLAEVRAGS